MGEPSTWSADRREAERDHRREQDRHARALVQVEKNKAAKRDRDQKKSAVRAERQAKYDRKVTVADQVIAGKREGKYRDIATVDHNPTERVDLPPAVGSGKPKKQTKAEKKAARAEAKRQKLIAKQQAQLPDNLTQEERELLTPAERPVEVVPTELSDADRLEQAAANRDQIVAAKTGPDASDPVIQAADALGDPKALAEAIDGPPTGLDWDASVPQEVRDAKEQEYIDRGLAKPGERILDDPLPISTAAMRRNALARKRQYEKIYEELKESVPPKVEDEEEYDALLVSHGEAVEAYGNLHSRFTSANLSKLQSGKISRSLVAQDMEKIIAAGVKDNLQKAKLLGYVAELKAIE